MLRRRRFRFRLWRVLIAVLGRLSGVGVLLYLIGWLIIPAEGDTGSPPAVAIVFIARPDLRLA